MAFNFIDDPRWETLDQDTKSKVLSMSFRDEIMSDPGWASLDNSKKQEVATLYFKDADTYSKRNIVEPEPEEEPGVFSTIGKGLAHGVLGLGEAVGTGVEYLGGRLESEKLQEVGETAKNFWSEKAGKFDPSSRIYGKNVVDDPEILKESEFWLYNVADMVPALAATIIPGVGVFRGLKAIPAVTKLAKLGGAIAGGLTGGALEGSQTYNAVLERGGTEKEAARSAELMFASSGALNALSVGKVLSKAGNTFKGKILKVGGAAAWEGITEGLEEPAEVFSKYFGAYLAGEELPTNLEEQLIESAKDALTVAPIAAIAGGGASVISQNIQPEKALSNSPSESEQADKSNDAYLDAIINEPIVDESEQAEIFFEDIERLREPIIPKPSPFPATFEGGVPDATQIIPREIEIPRVKPDISRPAPEEEIPPQEIIGESEALRKEALKPEIEASPEAKAFAKRQEEKQVVLNQIDKGEFVPPEKLRKFPDLVPEGQEIIERPTKAAKQLITEPLPKEPTPTIPEEPIIEPETKKSIQARIKAKEFVPAEELRKFPDLVPEKDILEEKPKAPEEIKDILTDAPIPKGIIKTGKPVKYHYTHNIEPAPDRGKEFAQDIEPFGKYIAPSSERLPKLKGLEKGIIEFQNPLVLEHKTTRHGGWKTDLSNMYDGKTGSELTEAILVDGHDGIITIDGNRISEGVILKEKPVIDKIKTQEEFKKEIRSPEHKPKGRLNRYLFTQDTPENIGNILKGKSGHPRNMVFWQEGRLHFLNPDKAIIAIDKTKISPEKLTTEREGTGEFSINAKDIKGSVVGNYKNLFELNEKGFDDFIKQPEVIREIQEPKVPAPFKPGDTIHTMPDGSIMPGPIHKEAVKGSERKATKEDVEGVQVERPSKKVGEVEERLLNKKADLENKIERIEKEIGISRKTDIPGTFITGREGVPKSRIKKIEAQTDKAIDRAVALEKAKSDLKTVESRIKFQEKAPTRKILEEKLAIRDQEQFESISVGDSIDIGGTSPLKVIKVNKKTIVTEGGSKWKADDIARVIKLKKQPPKKEPKLSTIEDITHLPGEGVTLKDIQKQFKGQEVFISPNKSVSVRMKNGQGLTIVSTKKISDTDTEYAVKTGRMSKSGIILGKFEEGTITLNEDLADTQTLSHETYHALKALGIITKADIMALTNKLNAFKKKNKLDFKPSKLKDKAIAKEENEANIFSQILKDRKDYRGTALGRVIQKVTDFLNGIVYIGRQSATKLAGEVETGKIFERKPTPEKKIQKPSEPKFQTTEDFEIEEDVFSVEDNSSLFDSFQYNVIDELSSVSKVYKAIGKDIPEAIDFRLKEELRISKSETDIKESKEEFDKPIQEIIAKSETVKDVAAVDEYLYARHAPEANARLRLTNARDYLNRLSKAQKGGKLKKKLDTIDTQFDLANIPTKEIQEAYQSILEEELENAKTKSELKVKKDWETFSLKPSGMTDVEAQKLAGAPDKEKGLKAGKWYGNKDQEAIAKIVDKMNNDSLKISFDAGRMSKEEYDAVKGTYDFYVPLFREGFEKERFGATSGLKNLGKDFAVRGGSTKKAVNLLLNSIAKHQQAIVNANKAEVSTAFVNFMKAFPNKDFWNFEETKTIPEYDGSGNIRRKPARNINDKEGGNEVQVKSNGKIYVVSANPENVHAMRIIGMMRGNPRNLGPVLNGLGRMNRYLAMINTTFNPEFIISNFLRDLQTGFFNLTDTEVKGMKGKIFKSIPSALAGLHSISRGDGKHELAPMARRYEKAGGKIGWIDYNKNIESRARKFESEIDLLKDGFITKKSINSLMKWVTDYNSIVENGIRLATFKAGVESGMSDSKAAIMAKDLTVNFNRKGAMGPAINSLYLFANAGIQGSTRLIRAIKNNPKEMGKLVGSTILAASGMAIANSAIGGEDDDGIPYYDRIEDHLKARNMIIMLPGSTNEKLNFLKIPAPWGYNVFWALGTEIGDAYVKEDYDSMEGASRMLATTLDAFNPLQSATFLQTISPTISDPFVQVGENKTFFGSPLMPEGNPFAKFKVPDSEKYWNSARTPSVWIAKQMNRLTTGDKLTPGLIDISPETLDLVFDTFTGGAGKFMANTLSLPATVAKGEFELAKAPFARRVVGRKSEHKVISDYRKNTEHIYRLRAKAKEFPKNLSKIRKDKTFFLFSAAKATDSQIRRLNKMLKRVKSKESKDRLKKQIEKARQRFNKKFIEKKEK